MRTGVRSRRRCALCGRIRRLADLVELRVDAVVRHQLGEWQPKRPELLPPGSVVCASHERRDSRDQVAAAVPLVTPLEFGARAASKRIAGETLVAAGDGDGALTLERLLRGPGRSAIADGLARELEQLELDAKTRAAYLAVATEVALGHLELLAALATAREDLAPALEAALELGMLCAPSPALEVKLQRGLPELHAIAKRAARDLEAVLHRGAVSASTLAELRLLLRLLEDGAGKLVESWRDLTAEGRSS